MSHNHPHQQYRQPIPPSQPFQPQQSLPPRQPPQPQQQTSPLPQQGRQAAVTRNAPPTTQYQQQQWRQAQRSDESGQGGGGIGRGTMRYRTAGEFENTGDDGDSSRPTPTHRSKTTHQPATPNFSKGIYNRPTQSGFGATSYRKPYARPTAQPAADIALSNFVASDQMTDDPIGNSSRQAAARRPQALPAKSAMLSPEPQPIFAFKKPAQRREQESSSNVRFQPEEAPERGTSYATHAGVPKTGLKTTDSSDTFSHELPSQAQLRQHQDEQTFHSRITQRVPQLQQLDPPPANASQYIRPSHVNNQPQYQDDQQYYSDEKYQHDPPVTIDSQLVDGREHQDEENDYGPASDNTIGQEGEYGYEGEPIQSSQVKPIIELREQREAKPNVEQLTGSIVTLQVEQREKIAELEVSNKQYEVQNHVLTDTLRTAGEERSRLQIRLDEAVKNVEKANKERDAKVKEVRRYAKMAINAMNDERSTFREHLKLWETRPRSLAVDTEELRTDIRTSIAEINAVAVKEGRIEAIRAELAGLKRTMEYDQDAKNTIREHKANVTRLTRELEEKRRDLIHERERAVEAESRAKDTAASFKAFQDEAERKKADKTGDIDYEKMRQEHFSAGRALAEAQNEVKHLNESLDIKAAIIASHEATLVQYEIKLKAMGCSLDELDELMDSDEEEVERGLRSTDKTSREAAEWNKRLETAAAEIAKLSDKLKDSETKLKESKLAVHDRDLRISNLDKVSGQMQATMESSERKIVELQGKMAAQKAEYMAKAQELSHAEKNEAVAACTAGERLAMLEASEAALLSERAEVKRVSELFRDCQQRLMDEKETSTKALVNNANKSPAKTSQPTPHQAEITKLKQTLEAAQKAKYTVEKTVESLTREVANLKLSLGKAQNEPATDKSKIMALAEELETVKRKAEDDIAQIKKELSLASILQRWRGRGETDEERSLVGTMRTEIRDEERRACERQVIELKNDLKRTQTQLGTAKASYESLVKVMDGVHTEMDGLKITLKRQELAAQLASQTQKNSSQVGYTHTQSSKRKQGIHLEESSSESEYSPSTPLKKAKPSLHLAKSNQDLEPTLSSSPRKLTTPSQKKSTTSTQQRKPVTAISQAENRRTRSNSSVAQPSQATSIDMPMATQNPSKRMKTAKK